MTNLRLPGQYDERLFAAAGISGPQGPYYNWNRWYLPGVGRYLELDPIALRGIINPYGEYVAAAPEWYSYVSGNPLSYLDALGLFKYTPRAGDPVNPDVEAALKCMDECLGQEVVVTGAKEKGHTTGSRHSTGNACDLGCNSNPGLCKRPDEVKKCFEKCFSKSSYGQNECSKNHFHFQDLPGKGGATGFAPGCK